MVLLGLSVGVSESVGLFVGDSVGLSVIAGGSVGFSDSSHHFQLLPSQVSLV